MINKVFRYTSLLALTLNMFACDWRSQLILENKSRYDLENLTVYAAEKVIWQGPLLSQEQISIDFHVNRDGAFKLINEQQNNAFNSQYLGYVTNNDNSRHKIIITDDNAINYELIID